MRVQQSTEATGKHCLCRSGNTMLEYLNIHILNLQSAMYIMVAGFDPGKSVKRKKGSAAGIHGKKEKRKEI